MGQERSRCAAEINTAIERIVPDACDGISFLDVFFDIKIDGDTSAVQTSSFAGGAIVSHFNQVPQATIDISGFGPAAITGGMEVFDTYSSFTGNTLFGMSDNSDALNEITVNAVGAGNYDLTTPFGPITGPDASQNPFSGVGTSDGGLTFDS